MKIEGHMKVKNVFLKIYLEQQNYIKIEISFVLKFEIVVISNIKFSALFKSVLNIKLSRDFCVTLYAQFATATATLHQRLIKSKR